jgi:hypothetical protein
MFQIIKRLSDSTITELTSAAYSLVPKMELSKSRYARGRKEIWLFHKANLGLKKKVNNGYYDRRWWEFAQKIYPGSHIGLITFGGEYTLESGSKDKSNAAINWHRDDSFSLPTARGLNFGARALFGYDSERVGVSPNSPTKRIYSLENGDVFEMDCKHEHCVMWHGSGRFSLVLWKLRLGDERYPELKLIPEIAALLNPAS